MGNHTAPVSYWSKVRDSITKHKIVSIILALFILAFLVNAVMAVSASAAVVTEGGYRTASPMADRTPTTLERRTRHCPGGKNHWRRTKYLGDERHAPLRLAEFNLRVMACYSHKGWIKKAKATVFVHSNGTASTLGYRYELRPGDDHRKRFRKHGHVWGVRLTRAASYKQCIPGVPGGVLTCGPDGEFHVEPMLYAPHLVKHDPWINHRFVFGGIWKDSGYAREFMAVYDTP